MLSSKELWQGALIEKVSRDVFQQRIERLKVALEQATALVTKWGKPMTLSEAVSFLKSNMDKEYFLDVSKHVALDSAQPAVPACVSKCCGHACSSLFGYHWLHCARNIMAHVAWV
jgi:hypothetical protein